MKKTLTINLNGVVFNIDEDAYEMLNQYLIDLGRHFAVEEKEEILKDIEARVAELFTENLVNRNVVEAEDVREVMATMGDPSEFEDNQEQVSDGPQTTQSENKSERKTHRKLYRDMANKRVGGVAAGVAAYMDWDVTVVRILFLLILLLSVGWTLFIYILMWIFIPEADSVSKRLEMQGVEPTAENIKNHAANMDMPISHEPSTFAKVLKVFAVVVLGFIGLGLFSSVIGVLIAVIMLIFNLLPIVAAANEILLLISTGLFLLCPAIAIVLLCVYLVSSNKPRRKWAAWLLFGLWIASFIGLCVFGANACRRYREDKISWHNDSYRTMECHSIGNDATVKFLDEPRSSKEFHSIDVEEAIWVKFSQGDTTAIHVKAPEDVIPNIRTYIRNGVLYIRNENERKRKIERVVVYVTAPSIKDIKISEASQFQCETPLKLDHLNVEVSEASKVTLGGEIAVLNVKAKEASVAELRDVVCDEAVIKAEEASLVNMGESQDLKIYSHTSSRVTYKGQPQRLTKQSTEFSEVRWQD